MVGHKICFYEEIWLIIPHLSLLLLPIWSTAYHAGSRGAVVSYWRKYMQEVLVNPLGGLSLPRKSVVRLTDCPDMTLDVYCGCKTTTHNTTLYKQTAPFLEQLWQTSCAVLRLLFRGLGRGEGQSAFMRKCFL